MKAPIRFIRAIALVLFVAGCEGLDDPSPIVKSEIRGFAQKGPYIIGSSVTVYELNPDLTQSGKSFNSQITDNSGSFSINNVELKSQFVEIKADGFYFNEVTGEKSIAPLTLYALSDVSDKDKVNTNIISSIEKDRVKFLMGQGISFSESKAQAIAEILKIFSFNDTLSTSSELLDISGGGDQNAILLAISLILQGYGTVADLSELIANISNDIKEDGELNNPFLGSRLVNNAKYLKLSDIRKKIESRYQEVGVSAIIGDFEKYIDIFLDNTNFQLTSMITYPKYGSYGENILSDSVTSFKPGWYSMTAYLPTGTSLKVTYGPVSGSVNDWYSGTKLESFVGWAMSDNNFPLYNQISATGSSVLVDNVSIMLIIHGSYRFDFYENNASTPTRTKYVNW